MTKWEQKRNGHSIKTADVKSAAPASDRAYLIYHTHHTNLGNVREVTSSQREPGIQQLRSPKDLTNTYIYTSKSYVNDDIGYRTGILQRDNDADHTPRQPVRQRPTSLAEIIVVKAGSSIM